MRTLIPTQIRTFNCHSVQKHIAINISIRVPLRGRKLELMHCLIISGIWHSIIKLVILYQVHWWTSFGWTSLWPTCTRSRPLQLQPNCHICL